MIEGLPLEAASVIARVQMPAQPDLPRFATSAETESFFAESTNGSG